MRMAEPTEKLSITVLEIASPPVRAAALAGCRRTLPRPSLVKSSATISTSSLPSPRLSGPITDQEVAAARAAQHARVEQSTTGPTAA